MRTLPVAVFLIITTSVFNMLLTGKHTIDGWIKIKSIKENRLVLKQRVTIKDARNKITFGYRGKRTIVSLDEHKANNMKKVKKGKVQGSSLMVNYVG